MRIALLGLAGSGKTAVFNAVADTPVATTPGALQTETHVQVVKVQDPRMYKLRDLFKPKKFTLAGLELHDPPGLPEGSEASDVAKRTRLLGALREADGYVLVVRGFATDSYAYPRPAPDPKADVARIVEELVVSDLALLNGRAERLRDNVKKRAKSLEQDQRELSVIERMLPRLEAGASLQELAFSPEDERLIRGFQLFSRKPYLLLVNGPAGVPAGVGDGVALGMKERIALDGMLAGELAAMDAADRPAFMAEFGIDEPASERVVHAVYQAAGLRSFFTVGEDEVRAWTIHVGDDAVTAASKIHSDLAKGFVRAEVTAYDAIIAAGGLKEAKAAMRLEGKEYVVADGDIVHIRSSV